MLYYTGAKKPEDRQDNPSLSLGGYKSSSQIPNGEINNIFPKITQSTVIDNKKIIRMIVFQNLFPSTITNIKIWTKNGYYSKILSEIVLPAYDSKCERFFFEELKNEEILPYQGSLLEHNESNPLVLNSLESGKYIGIWLRKELILDNFTSLDKGLTCNGENCDELLDILKKIESGKEIDEDQIEVHIEWN